MCARAVCERHGVASALIGIQLSRGAGGNVDRMYDRLNVDVDTTFGVFTGAIIQRHHVPFRMATSPFCSTRGVDEMHRTTTRLSTKGNARRRLVRGWCTLGLSQQDVKQLPMLTIAERGSVRARRWGGRKCPAR